MCGLGNSMAYISSQPYGVVWRISAAYVNGGSLQPQYGVCYLKPAISGWRRLVVYRRILAAGNDVTSAWRKRQ